MPPSGHDPSLKLKHVGVPPYLDGAKALPVRWKGNACHKEPGHLHPCFRGFGENHRDPPVYLFLLPIQFKEFSLFHSGS